jgi:CO/xanthine dehydrogenase FAD-binding subunit
MGRWREARSIDDAVVALAGGATILGGGAALLSTAFPLQLGPDVVDVGAVLHRTISDAGIGAGATLAQLAADPTVRRRWPAVARAAELTATPQVRETATVGGTVGAALLTSDLLPALVVHGAEVDLALVDGTRVRLPLAEHLADVAARGPALVLSVHPTIAGRGTHRRIARREGPAPALASVSGVRTGEGVVLVAGAVGATAAPVPVDPATGRPTAALRSDRRADAELRARLVDALVREVTADLEEAT